MNTLLGLYLMGILTMGQAGPVEDAASRHNEQAFESMQRAQPSQIPGYTGTDVSELEHANDLRTNAHESVRHDPIKTDTIQQAENLSTPETLPGYCGEGDCYQPDVISHQQDVNHSAAVLESTFGGEKANTNSSDVRIYTGKIEKCEHDNWGEMDCCTDEGWGINWNLSQCSVETRKLGDKKAAGLCHHVGHYDVKKRKAGIVVKIIEYETYCCFPSFNCTREINIRKFDLCKFICGEPFAVHILFRSPWFA